MKQTNIEKLKQIVLDMINNGGTEEDLPAVITHIDNMLQEDDGWIQVSECTPICYKEGEWDGKKSDEVLIQNKDGRYTIAVLYEGFLDGSHFKDWYGQDDWELEIPIKWKEIN